MNVRSSGVKGLAAGFFAVLVLMVFFFGNGSDETGLTVKPNRSDRAGHDTPGEMGEGANEVYVCPMMCTHPLHEPGKCPVCGMDLVSVAAGGDAPGDEGAARIHLESEALKLADIRLSKVSRKFVASDVRLFGQIDYDPAHISNITAWMPGVIDRVYVKRAGQFVRWGDPLFDLYSTDLLETQKQMIGALKYVPGFFAFQKDSPHVAREVPIQAGGRGADADAEKVETAMKTISAIRHKLSILGLPKRDIDEFMKVGEATGIATVTSPIYGQVIDQKAFEGSYLNTGATVFTIADPQYVWAKLEAYESDYPWIRRNQEAAISCDAYPGERFMGKVVYIDPYFNSDTRTFDIGVLIPDQGGRMKAGMLVRGVISARLTAGGKIVDDHADIKEAPLVIPASAPLITGKRAVVYVSVPGETGVFEGREVTLGPKATDFYVVLDGLSEDEMVVVNGNFKIDSSLQIMAKSSMMSIEGGHSATAHHHHGGSEGLDVEYKKDRMKSRTTRRHNSEGPEIEQGVRGRRPSRTDTIRRRRPGSYGDTSRTPPSE